MATKGKQSSAASNDDATITRIKATSSKIRDVAARNEKRAAANMNMEASKNPVIALGRYFKGSWYELRQVRWPDRKSTWSLTGAVLLFTAFFIVIILLLDALFKYIFELILG